MRRVAQQSDGPGAPLLQRLGRQKLVEAHVSQWCGAGDGVELRVETCRAPPHHAFSVHRTRPDVVGRSERNQ